MKVDPQQRYVVEFQLSSLVAEHAVRMYVIWKVVCEWLVSVIVCNSIMRRRFLVASLDLFLCGVACAAHGCKDDRMHALNSDNEEDRLSYLPAEHTS